MVAIVVLPTVLLLAIVIVGYYVNREHLFEMARALQNKKTFASEAALLPREAAPLVPTNDKVHLDRQGLRQATAELAAYARAVDPDWIVGVHPGGRLLSVLIANEIKFSKDRCLFIRTSSNRTNRFVFEPQRYRSNMPFEGRVLVVDDISRSGKTLQNLKRFLVSRNYRTVEGEDAWCLTKVNFAVLLVVSQPDEAEYNFRPDWVHFRTDKKYFQLPWSDLSAKIDAAFAHRRQGLDFDSSVIEQHEKLASDFDYASELANEYVAAEFSASGGSIRPSVAIATAARPPH